MLQCFEVHAKHRHCELIELPRKAGTVIEHEALRVAMAR